MIMNVGVGLSMIPLFWDNVPDSLSLIRRRQIVPTDEFEGERVVRWLSMRFPDTEGVLLLIRTLLLWVASRLDHPIPVI